MVGRRQFGQAALDQGLQGGVLAEAAGGAGHRSQGLGGTVAQVDQGRDGVAQSSGVGAVGAGIDLAFGSRHVDFRFARWRTEVDQGDIDSYGVGFLTPAGPAADIEFRLAYDDSETFGGATVFSVFLYLFDE